MSIRIDGDLGYDDSYPSFSGEADLRWGRHDLWSNGTHFEEAEDRRILAEFKIDGGVFDIGAVVDSEVSTPKSPCT